MALTPFQRDVCRLLADARRAAGESDVAGGVALSVALQTQRMSRDLDLFHDTTEAVARSWDRDRSMLAAAGYGVEVLRERPGYVEADISRPGERLTAEWARDSAFRFFPLVEHEALGLTLHPFDLATNKVLALVGRREPRDWVDVIACDARVQPLGYLSWAACGKDPGFTPQSILDQAGRSSHYSEEEIAALSFEGSAPRAADLSQTWHRAVAIAFAVVGRLPSQHVGEAVLTAAGELFRGDLTTLERALTDGRLLFHRGRIGGAWPQVRPSR